MQKDNGNILFPVTASEIKNDERFDRNSGLIGRYFDGVITLDEGDVKNISNNSTLFQQKKPNAFLSSKDHNYVFESGRFLVNYPLKIDVENTSALFLDGIKGSSAIDLFFTSDGAVSINVGEDALVIGDVDCVALSAATISIAGDVGINDTQENRDVELNATGNISVHGDIGPHVSLKSVHGDIVIAGNIDPNVGSDQMHSVNGNIILHVPGVSEPIIFTDGVYKPEYVQEQLKTLGEDNNSALRSAYNGVAPHNSPILRIAGDQPAGEGLNNGRLEASPLAPAA